MTHFPRVLRFTMLDLLKSRWLLGYALALGLVTDLLLRFSDSAWKAGLSMISVVLLVVPVMSLVVGAMVIYAAREFTELLLAQPVKRRDVFLAQYVGLAVPLSVAFAGGLVVPFIIHGAIVGDGARMLAALVGAGVALTWIFSAIAQLIAVRFEDRVRGLAAALSVWLLMTILYDGLVLSVAATFSAYPIERPMLAMLVLNPVDLARLALLLQFDTGAMLGYTGAVFRSYFSGPSAPLIAMASMLVWIALPFSVARRAFMRKDF
jgi:Cu-processing system permease protein